MTLEELHNNKALRCREFPVVGKEVFLASGQVSPLPRRVADEISKYSSNATFGNQEDFVPQALTGDTRRLLADLLGCRTSEIAFVGPTSVGLSLIANGLSLKPGENVVFYQNDYPSNAVVWINLRKRGVELRTVRPTELGVITIDSLRPLVDSRTRLVALTSAHFVSGFRIDLNAIGAWLKELGVLFAVDGIQTVGAIPTPVKYVDFLATDSYKWLLGPCAAGILFVSTDAQKSLEPTLLGWNNVLCPNFIAQDTIEFKNGAERYEAGSHNHLGLVGLHASLTLLREFGTTNIAEMVLGYTRYLRDALRTKGYSLASSDDEQISGITSFRREGKNMETLFQQLTAARITASLRSSVDGCKWIRFSPHFYNTKTELDFALALL